MLQARPVSCRRNDISAEHDRAQWDGQEDRIMAITKIVLKLMKQNGR
jgi:hypothetical protein